MGGIYFLVYLKKVYGSGSPDIALNPGRGQTAHNPPTHPITHITVGKEEPGKTLVGRSACVNPDVPAGCALSYGGYADDAQCLQKIKTKHHNI